MTDLERRIEIKEREERRTNIIIKEVEMKEGKKREVLEDVLRVIGVKAEIEEIRKLEGQKAKDREMLMVKIKDEARKRVIIKKERIEG